jgi:hypothetical protein
VELLDSEDDVPPNNLKSIPIIDDCSVLPTTDTYTACSAVMFRYTATKLRVSSDARFGAGLNTRCFGDGGDKL